MIIILGLLGLDRWFYETVSLRFNTPSQLDGDLYRVTRVFWMAVRLGGHVIGVGLAYVALITLTKRSVREANAMVISVMLVTLAAYFLQNQIGRSRPDWNPSYLDFHPTLTPVWDRHGVSFPSNEASVAFALACLLSRMFPRRAHMFCALAVLVAAARVLAGAHYLSDVAAGALLATSLAPWMYDRALRTQAAIWPGKSPVPSSPDDTMSNATP